MNYLSSLIWGARTALSTQAQQVQKVVNDFPVLDEEAGSYGLWGDLATDPFPFLEDVEDARTVKFLADNVAYTAKKTGHLDAAVVKIKGEIAGQVVNVKTVGDINLLTTRVGDFEYYWDESTYYRQSNGTDPVAILSWSEVQQNCGDFKDWGFAIPSPDGKFLAFSLDVAGGEKYDIYVKDLTQNKILPDSISMADGSVVWCKDNSLCYVKLHENNYRPYKAQVHTMGTPAAKDVVVYEEKDEQFVLSIQGTYSSEYFVMTSNHYDSGEVRLLSTKNPTSVPAPLAVRKPGFRYFAVLHEDGVYIRASDNYSNFALYKAKEGATSTKDWTLCKTADRDITDIIPFKDYLVLACREEGLPQFSVYDLKIGIETLVKGYALAPCWSASATNYCDYNSSTFIFNYSDPLTPPIAYAYDLKTNALSIITQTEVSGTINVADYKIQREMVTAKDGTLIPIDMIYSKKITNLTQNHPMVVEAYGSYGVCFDTFYTGEIFPLLQRGVVYMYSHPRGGGEFGQKWYVQGKKLAKATTFDDFDACLRHAVAKGYTTKGQLAARGKSAGGFLIGYQMTRDETVASCFLNRKGWTRVLKSMCEPQDKYANTEKSEWGDPNVKAEYTNLKTLSPENRVDDRAYPTCLTIGAKDDTDVPIDVEASWVALVQKHQTGSCDQLLKYEGSGGHYDDPDSEMPFEFAFVLDKIGATL